ncbi:MAG: hypothetical protein JJU40_01265 [Rhodobacteraceae bacterium]|nr:hypothetical protein [Paracoccaceae bacterium]
MNRISRYGSAMALVATLLVPLAMPAVAQTPCFADYKAKRDAPLRLHYGVMQLPIEACAPAAARAVVARRLAAAGWELLSVVSLFGPEGIEPRRADAGEYFLAF